MKGKILPLFLIFFAFSFTSCTKESFSYLNGQWFNVAEYKELQTGTYGWVQVNGYHHFYQFWPTRFVSYFDDSPGGGGIYSFDKRSGELTLTYEADQYGNTLRTEIVKVERLSKTQLVISYYSPAGNFVYKTEYSKVD